MHKYLLLYILLFWLPMVARGQTITDLPDIDLSGLPQTTQAKALRYWIDDDTDNMQTSDILNGRYTVDVSSLIEGLHTIHFQIIDSENKVAAPYSGIFLKMDSRLSSSEASTLRYWFDDNTNVSTCNANIGAQLLDASALLDGLHSLHYQVVDTEGNASYVASGIFLKMGKMADAGEVKAEKLIYWFDDEQTTTTIDMLSGIMTLDASNLLDGLHTVHYLVVCNDGSATSAYSSIFLKMEERDGSMLTAQSLRYWFDDDKEVKTTCVAGGTQIIDVTDLLAGLHTLHYQLVDSNGGVSSPTSRIFLKNFDKVLADGENRITKYQYWLNMNTQAMQTAELDAADNPYTLITLLPVQKEPIRTERFHFEITDEQPVIYAKNDFHIRFTDAQGYFKDGALPSTVILVIMKLVVPFTMPIICSI